MAQNITLLGANYSAVPAVILPKTGGGTARFDDASVTTAVASDVASGKIFLASDGAVMIGTNSGGGGGSGLDLLTTLSMGTINATNTQAADTGKIISVSGINSYDALIVETSVDIKINNHHAATIAYIWLTASSNIATKNGTAMASAKWNCKLSGNGTPTTRSSTTAYGIYPYSATVNSDTVTIQMYQRYNSTQTGTINNSYTARVYGLKLYDLIGG